MMTPLDRSQKESIARRLVFIETELGDLAEYRGLTYESYSEERKTRRNVERIIENIANASTDIAKILLAGEASELPESYREAMSRLGTMDIIAGSLADKMAEITRTRNVLAHQYLDVRWRLIEDFLATGHQAVGEFVERVSAFLEKQ